MNRTLNSFVVSIFGFIVAAGTVEAHGEDKPGPHGGFIRMPGAFHTELVPVVNATGVFRVYLLDIEFKNPVVADSSVRVRHVSTGSALELACAPVRDHFRCLVPSEADLTVGKLVVDASRQGLPSAAVEYHLPLATRAGSSTGEP